MMVGFSKGFVVCISTHMKEIGEELQAVQLHEGFLIDMTYVSIEADMLIYMERYIVDLLEKYAQMLFV